MSSPIDPDDELRPYPRHALFVLVLKIVLGVVATLTILGTLGEHL